jgi:hypothetical protein
VILSGSRCVCRSKYDSKQSVAASAAVAMIWGPKETIEAPLFSRDSGRTGQHTDTA